MTATSGSITTSARISATRWRASVRVAESAGADLRPQIDALVKMTALYPKSDVAHEFPREAADAKKHDRGGAGEAAGEVAPRPRTLSLRGGR